MSTMRKHRVIALTMVLVFLCTSSGVTFSPRHHTTVYSDTYWLLKIINSLWTIQTAYADESSDDSQDEMDDLETTINQLKDQWKDVQKALTNAYAASLGANKAKKAQSMGMEDMAALFFSLAGAYAAQGDYAAAAILSAMGADCLRISAEQRKKAEESAPPINTGQQLADNDSLKEFHESLEDAQKQLGLLYDEGSELIKEGIIGDDLNNFLNEIITGLMVLIPADGGIKQDIITDANAIKDDVLELLAKEEGALSDGVDAHQENVNASIQNSIRDILR